MAETYICNGEASLSCYSTKPTIMTKSTSFKAKKKTSITRSGFEVDKNINLLHDSDPVKLELNRLNNKIRDKERELGDARAENKALWYSERLKEKAVEEMASSEAHHIHNKVPIFDGSNYKYWKIRMEVYLKSLGYGVWLAIKNGYKLPTTDITDATEMKNFENDSKAMNALFNSLVDNEFARVVNCTNSKEVWDKLKNVHEGNEMVREAKLQHHRTLFENLIMFEEETVEHFMNRVNEIVNSIRGLGEHVKDAVVVQNILWSLPDLYNAKVSAIEECDNLDAMTLDELYGKLIAFEMRMVNLKPTKKEATFKALKKLKIKEDSDSEDSDDELIAYLARKLKKGKRKI